MPHQVQQLINKIRSEGIDQANAKAKEIEKQAQEQAERIIHEADKQAQNIITTAETEAQKLQEAGERTLTQSARNMLISLRKDIQSMMTAVVTREVGQALSSEQLQQMIEKAVVAYTENQGKASRIDVLLSEKDQKAFSDHLLNQLKERCRQDLSFKPSEDVATGFVMSFDEGKSQFDFTDKGVAEFLSAYVNDELKHILNKAVVS